jgi:hypothetical protein
VPGVWAQNPVLNDKARVHGEKSSCSLRVWIDDGVLPPVPARPFPLKKATHINPPLCCWSLRTGIFCLISCLSIAIRPSKSC